ncbi:MAG TPA: endonuclease/exonuclease/phosphatase family protein [Thermoanaerobaculia bacterium]|jgi:endonuclease/exonuclease/phosphatase family metal-dependent hydrolase|nr:endonuclease/exonuclease/phosphatase family protein [Thermoanaerobaculia bacterium]
MRRIWKIALILGAIVTIAVAYRVLGVYEFRAGECTALQPRKFASTYPKRIVVMTFNIEGHAALLRGDHIEEVAKTIRKYNPDIVAINEAHRNTWQSRFSDHVEQLRRLTGMNGVFGRSYTFLGGEFGNAVLTRGDVLKADVHKLPGTGEPRSLLEAVVRVNGGVVEMYVTHTTAWASINKATRDTQLQCVNAHLQASGHPFIVAGDLNAPPESEEIALFLNRNVLKIAGDPKTPTHRVMEQRLDYILADPGWTVRSARVLDDGPSDHRPVIAELGHP